MAICNKSSTNHTKKVAKRYKNPPKRIIKKQLHTFEVSVTTWIPLLTKIGLFFFSIDRMSENGMLTAVTQPNRFE